MVLNRREEQKRKDRERKRRRREDPAFRKMEARKSAARMKAKRSNPIYREAEAARQRKKRNQQTLTKSDHEKRLTNARYIAAEYSFKMQICAVNLSLYIAGRVGDTNKDTTNCRKRISRRANNKKDTDLNINGEDGEERPTMDQKGQLQDVAIHGPVDGCDRQGVAARGPVPSSSKPNALPLDHNVRQLFCGTVCCTRL